VFATNTLTVLPEVNLIVVMKEGRIHETGTYEQLRMNGGEFSNLLQEHLEENARQKTSTMEGRHHYLIGLMLYPKPNFFHVVYRLPAVNYNWLACGT